MDKYKTTFETWNKIADLYQAKFMDLALYDDSYDFFCGQIKKINPRILEVGCGPGNITKYLLSKRADFEIYGIDIAPNMIQLAKLNNPTADFEVMDARQIDELTETFDAIICGFCMPYLSKKDCRKLIRDCGDLLNDGGICYFSAIEGDYQQSGYESGSTGDQAYVYYHEVDFLQQELKKHQLSISKIIRIPYPINQSKIQTHLILIASK